MTVRSLTALSLILAAVIGRSPQAPAAEEVREAALPVRAVRAFENLIFDRPIVVTHAGDGSKRIFVAEQKGRLMVFPNDADVEEAETFLDIRDRCVPLTDAWRFNDDEIKARRSAGVDRLMNEARHFAVGFTRGDRAEINLRRIDRIHADAVAEKGSAALAP